MEVSVSILKKDVMPEVYKITGYTGMKGADMDGVSSTEDDKSILDSYFSEAGGSLADVLSREGVLSDETDEGLTYLLELPANWKQGVKPALTKAMRLYVTEYVCMQWFNLAKKEEVKYYAALCTEQASGIKKYLLERERPTRKF